MLATPPTLVGTLSPHVVEIEAAVKEFGGVLDSLTAEYLRGMDIRSVKE